MEALLTGSHGTVGSAVTAHVRAAQGQAAGWNWREADPADAPAVAAYLQRHQPDVLFHLAVPSRPTGKPDEGRLLAETWTRVLATQCRALGVRFVYSSTVMVFSDRARGPFTAASEPDAPGGYGHEKRLGEQAALHANSEAVVVRLGWQIGDQPGSNNMVDFFATRMREDGVVRANTGFMPACAYLPDTAEALVRAAGLPGGIYMADANRGWSFHEIAVAVNERHGRPWKIEACDEFRQDQRMIDERLVLPPLSMRFPLREI